MSYASSLAHNAQPISRPTSTIDNSAPTLNRLSKQYVPQKKQHGGLTTAKPRTPIPGDVHKWPRVARRLSGREHRILQPTRSSSGHGRAARKAPDMQEPPASRSEQTVVYSAQTTLTKWDFELCRQTLKEVFQCCTDFQFLRLITVISCLLHCLEPLHRREILTILRLLLGDGAGDCEASGMCEDDVVRWLEEQCEAVILVDVSGFYHFAHPSLPSFLRAVPIKGVDRTHQTLAKACLMEVENCVIEDLEQPSPGPENPHFPQFSIYAAKFWKEHYRCVEILSPGLAARVHRILTHSQLANLPDMGAQLLEEALEYCQKSNFRVLCHIYSQTREHRNRFLAGTRRATPLDTNGGSFQLADSVRNCMASLRIAELGRQEEPEWVIV